MTMAQNFEIQLQGLMVRMLTIEKKFVQIVQKLLIVSLILLFFSTPLVFGAQPIERKKILVLFSFRPTLPVASQWDRGLRSVFENNSVIKPTINFEHLDLTHFGDEQHVNMLLDLYRYKYSNPMPDLVIPVLDSSLDLMLKYGDKVFPGVPIVFGGVESQFIKNRSLRSNITGYLTDINYTGTLELALDLHKDLLLRFTHFGMSVLVRV